MSLRGMRASSIEPAAISWINRPHSKCPGGIDTDLCQVAATLICTGWLVLRVRDVERLSAEEWAILDAKQTDSPLSTVVPKKKIGSHGAQCRRSLAHDP